MRKMPALATALLSRFGPQDESFVGDLAEEYSGGRSRSWYWRQVLAAIVLASGRHIDAHPLRATMAVATGWGTALLLFFTLGDRVANVLAGWLWDWDRQTAYQTGVWWPFAIAAWMVSYAGFVISAAVVARVHRRHAGPMLVAYAASMLVVLAVSAVLIEVLSRLWDNRVPVPHTLFYVVSVALPFHWRSGLVLAPATILVAGLLADGRRGVGGRRRSHLS
jgi:hypothetical protein